MPGDDPSPSDAGTGFKVETKPLVPLGVALRRGWLGYRRRLDDELAAEGFDDRGLSDERVLAVTSVRRAVTISCIGRELGMTRQGASKIVASLRERGYLTVTPWGADARQKIVELAPRAREYLEAHEVAARRIEDGLRREFGDVAIERFYAVLESLQVTKGPA
ncbi:MAG TPA: helix-turn-helix domain-containing protein [Acidimicrobiales bacterium]|nr:helix-turn-helix domain-containing protein [Acidimicrobiales bacterium]